VGRSGFGKTRFIESLIPELRSRGLRVAYVKHCHMGFELDQGGKDSGRARRAGAHIVVLTSPKETARIEQCSSRLLDLARELSSRADIVVAEGFKSEPVKKIEILRQGTQFLCSSDPNLVAVISDTDIESRVPRFGTSDLVDVADFLESRIVGKEKPKVEVDLLVDGASVDLNDFVKSMIHKTVVAMVSNLRGAEEPGEIRLTIKQTKGGDTS
jgi:molybdopterin-guanine dinucleotide biosynthesis protein B